MYINKKLIWKYGRKTQINNQIQKIRRKKLNITTEMNLKRFFQGEKMAWPPLSYQKETETKCPLGRGTLSTLLSDAKSSVPSITL